MLVLVSKQHKKIIIAENIITTVEIIISQHGNKNIPLMDPHHPWKTVRDVSQDDVQVIRDRMSHDGKWDLVLLWITAAAAWVAECMELSTWTSF
jgi:hypothetical protein